MAIKNDTMKTIKVFIASSEELKIERLEFTDMIQQLNRILKLYDIQIEPEKWEYLDSSMGLKHKQEEYNDVLKTCEMCVVLFGRSLANIPKVNLKLPIVSYVQVEIQRNSTFILKNLATFLQSYFLLKKVLQQSMVTSIVTLKM